MGSQDSDTGLNLIYVPGSAPSINFSAPSAQPNWFWNRSNSTPQMELNASNQLRLYATYASVPNVILDPTPGGASMFPANIFLSTLQNSHVGVYLFRDGCAATSGGAAYGLRYTDTTNVTPIANRTSLIACGNEVLVASWNGNVGIGTTLPAERLDVVGNAKISGTLTVNGQSVATANQLTSYATTSQLATYQSATGSGAGLTDLNASALATGTLPASVLPPEVVQTAATQTLTNKTLDSTMLTGTTRLGGFVEYGEDCVLSVAPGAINFDAPNIPGGRFFISGLNGNVGLGTTTPTEKLDVVGNAKVSGTLRVNGQSVAGEDCVLSVAPGAINFDAPGVPGGRFFISGLNGNVGLGTTVPTEKLHVIGNIKASGIVSAAKICVSESGDLPMGDFTVGTNPTP